MNLTQVVWKKMVINLLSHPVTSRLTVSPVRQNASNLFYQYIPRVKLLHCVHCSHNIDRRSDSSKYSDRSIVSKKYSDRSIVSQEFR